MPECQYMQKIDAVQEDNFTHAHDVEPGRMVCRNRFADFARSLQPPRMEFKNDDRIEEQEPKFYVRQMMIDFEKDIREAWKLKGEDLLLVLNSSPTQSSVISILES